MASYLHLACMCVYACCCGDTWASEVGTVVGTRQPVLITTLYVQASARDVYKSVLTYPCMFCSKPVPPGTNGGISPVGIAMSVLGGSFIGATHLVALALLTDPLSTSVADPPQVMCGVHGVARPRRLRHGSANVQVQRCSGQSSWPAPRAGCLDHSSTLFLAQHCSLAAGMDQQSRGTSVFVACVTSPLV
jgi:hypothetical protein